LVAGSRSGSSVTTARELFDERPQQIHPPRTATSRERAKLERAS
jgi:hypothetical protein